MVERVVVTGLGVVSPVGIGKDAFWDSLINGRSGIDNITHFDTGDFKCKIAGEVPDFDPDDYGISKREAKRLDPFGLYGQVAVELALRDSGLDLSKDTEKLRTGAIIGTGIGGLKTLEDQIRVLMEKGSSQVSALMITKLMANAVAANSTIRHSLRGPSFSVASACAGGSHSIITAYQNIVLGNADVIFAGGSEAAITPVGIAAFTNMKALTTKYNNEPKRASRPFDAKRSGFVMGEGAGVIVLESLEHALKRGAKIYAELVGCGMSSDGHHITEPTVEGAQLAMEYALTSASRFGLYAGDVDHISAHGTGTKLNDINETEAIKRVFKDHAREIAISSIKSVTGHLLGAAGGIEAIACILAITNSIVPPTINLENPDDDCDLDYVPNKARALEVEVAMNNSFGFGGHDAVTIFKRYVR